MSIKSLALMIVFLLLIPLSGCLTDLDKEADNEPEDSTYQIEDDDDTVIDNQTGDDIVQKPNFEILSEHPFECMNTGVFDKFINVYGVYVVASDEAPVEYLNHTAHILAQLIDNDEDGAADNSQVLNILVENNYIIPVWNTSDRDEFWTGARGTHCEDNIGMAASMYYDEDQWALGGIQSAGIWDTNLEEVWHVVSVGWYETYPEYMGTEDENGEIISSNLTRALDAARGGHYESVPEQYPEDAWYTYYDDSCNYHCQAHEYFYWLLMANIGALDSSITDKCEESKHEWNVCNNSELETTDTLGYDLFNNNGFNFPTKIPDGSYQSDSGDEN